MGTDLLVPYCLWFNLHKAGVFCGTLISPGLPVIPAIGPTETASGFHLPTSISFHWEEAQVSWRNSGSSWSSCGMSWWQSPCVVWKVGWGTGCLCPSGGSVQLTGTSVICWRVCYRKGYSGNSPWYRDMTPACFASTPWSLLFVFRLEAEDKASGLDFILWVVLSIFVCFDQQRMGKHIYI